MAEEKPVAHPSLEKSATELELTKQKEDELAKLKKELKNASMDKISNSGKTIPLNQFALKSYIPQYIDIMCMILKSWGKHYGFIGKYYEQKQFMGTYAINYEFSFNRDSPPLKIVVDDPMKKLAEQIIRMEFNDIVTFREYLWFKPEYVPGIFIAFADGLKASIDRVVNMIKTLKSKYEDIFSAIQDMPELISDINENLFQDGSLKLIGIELPKKELPKKNPPEQEPPALSELKKEYSLK